MPLLQNVIRAQDIDKQTIFEIFRLAKEAEERLAENKFSMMEIFPGRIMAVLFYEPSTRTRLSFESAMIKLGGRIIGTENAKEYSSKAKGESLEDTTRTINGYGVDVVVLRYHKEGGAQRAQNFLHAPLLNAGDGTGQHPTQGLLDLYTIHKEFGTLKNLDIALVGDLLNGRTVRSLCYFIGKRFPKNKIHLVSPPQTKMKDDIKDYLTRKGVWFQELDKFDDILPDIDVLYQTRVQEERFKPKLPNYLDVASAVIKLIYKPEEAAEILKGMREQYSDDSNEYKKVVTASKHLIITPEVANKMKESAIIMHPLPRKGEILYSVDSDPRARYFEQAENGLYVRIALLQLLLK